MERVLAHEVPLGGVEGRRLADDRGGDVELADVVEQGRPQQPVAVGLGQDELVGEQLGDHADALAVAAGALVVLAQRGDEREHDVGDVVAPRAARPAGGAARRGRGRAGRRRAGTGPASGRAWSCAAGPRAAGTGGRRARRAATSRGRRCRRAARTATPAGRRAAGDHEPGSRSRPGRGRARSPCAGRPRAAGGTASGRGRVRGPTCGRTCRREPGQTSGGRPARRPVCSGVGGRVVPAGGARAHRGASARRPRPERRWAVRGSGPTVPAGAWAALLGTVRRPSRGRFCRPPDLRWGRGRPSRRPWCT